MGFGLYFVFDTGKYAQFTFYGNVVLMGVVHYFFNKGNIFLIRMRGTIIDLMYWIMYAVGSFIQVNTGHDSSGVSREIGRASCRERV